MASKIEGYREQGSAYETRKPKEVNKEIKSSEPVQGPSMKSTIEEHMKSINSGRGNVPDNYKEKKSK